MKTTGLKFILMFSILSLFGAISLASLPVNFFTGKQTAMVEVRDPKRIPKAGNEHTGFYGQVQRSLPCPDFLREERTDVKARLLISVSDQGRIHVARVVTDDVRVEQYIKSMLNDSELKLSAQECGRLYNFSVHFKIL